MNLDLNALSALMQLMGKPEQAPAPKQRAESGSNVSAFALQNGIGERLDLSEKPKNAEKANPMASILSMLGADKQGDAASTLMPMLMNLLKRPAPQKTDGTPQNAAEAKQSGEKYVENENGYAEKAHENAKKSPQQRNEYPYKYYEGTQSSQQTSAKADMSSPKTRHSEGVTKDDIAQNASATRLSPISFAGYTAISALNVLHNWAHGGERS